MIKSSPLLKDQLYKLVLISIGALPGGILRWQINNNLTVNIIGSLILGFVFGYKVRFPFLLIIGVGFCGSLTTFSSWIIDCFYLILKGQIFHAIVSIIFTLLFGLSAAWLGFFIGRRIK